jgi:hypothetical protein
VVDSLIPTLGALFSRGGPVQDSVLTPCPPPPFSLARKDRKLLSLASLSRLSLSFISFDQRAGGDGGGFLGWQDLLQIAGKVLQTPRTLSMQYNGPSDEMPLPRIQSS